MTLAEKQKALKAAEDSVERNPSEKQKIYGNYTKGHIWLWGFHLTLETPKGATRSGKDSKGKRWSITMANTYGYIKRTESEADGDHIDIFVGPHLDSEVVFVIDQYVGGKFDEHKCVLGALSKKEAKAIYQANYASNWNGFGGITALTLKQFKNWVANGDTGSPLAGQKMAEFHKHAAWDKGASHAVDLDGTLAEYDDSKPFDPKHIGKPIKSMWRLVRMWLRHGEEVVIFTARAADKKNIPIIRKWLKEHDIEECSISNEKTPEMEDFHDDRAITVEKNTGKILTKKAGALPKAVIVKGNPKYITGNPEADVFYQAIRAELEKQGYDVSEDPGEPYTSPDETADLWVGHSRGVDRLRFAPPHVRTLGLGAPLRTDGTRIINDPRDPSGIIPEGWFSKGFDKSELSKLPGFKEGYHDPKAHYNFTDEMRQALIDLAQTKTAGITKDYTPSESNDGIHAMPWLDNFVREAEHGYQSQSMHGETLRPISDKSVLKTASSGWHRPENFDRIKDFNTPKMEVWAGCDDWESGWTRVGFYPPNESRDAEGYPKEPAAWFQINHEQCPGCKGTLDGNKSDGRVCAEWAKKITRKVIKAADNNALERNGDWYEEIKEDLKPYIADHSGNRNKSAAFKAGQIKLTDTATINQIDAASIPKTGPEAILHRLQNMDLDAIEKQAHADIASGKVTRRPKAVKLLNVVEGMRRNEITPDQLMIKSVPVIPAIFRPFSVAGSTFIPGDANELYRDLFTTRDLYKETADELGDEAMGDARLQLYNAVKAVHGFGDPVNPKTATRGVSGFLQKIIGSSPKFSYFQRKLLSKPQDTVSRATITINPDLKLDEIGIPEEFAWKNYAPYIQRRMVQLGYSPGAAIKAIKDQTDEARKALVAELPHRPIIYSRAPAWHRFNTIAGKPVLTKGHTIEINPFVTTGHNADFDGDQMNIHVPSSDDAVKEAFDRLMPSKMVFSIRDPDKITPNLKHEQILSLFAASQRPAKQKVTFASREDALKAIERGDVSLSDEIEFPQPTAA